jgi:sulfide:quinone oxidoreductase
MSRRHVLVLGANFAGLTTARLIRHHCGDAVDITVIDRKPYLLFVPNIPLEVFDGHDPAEKLQMPVVKILHDDGDVFLQGEVTEIDVDAHSVCYTPTERPGAAGETVRYDSLVIALGARLDYAAIEGFGEFGHTVSDTFYGNQLRRYLYSDAYKGGPIAVGSARFTQGTTGRPAWLPEVVAACEGPPLEIGLSLAAWLTRHGKGGARNITLFTPGEWISEDAGLTIVKQFLKMASEMGFGYKNKTQDIKRLAADGVEFTNGESLEAELKIVLPNWNPHEFLKELPIVDDAGFVITDRLMRNQDHPEVFAVGDAAALAAPKLGGIGDAQARVVARQIAKDVGKMTAEEADEPFTPMVVCYGDMGDHKAFYIHSNEFFGGEESVLKMGHAYYLMKLGFKEMFYRTGGMPPKWGIPVSEMIGDQL